MVTKRVRKKQVRKEKPKVVLELKFIILSVLAGLLYYAAYLLNIPNSYALIISLVFIVSLIKKIGSISGINILIYILIFSMITIFSELFTSSSAYTIASIVIDLLIMGILIFGLINLRKWALYFSLVVIAISAVVSIIGLVYLLSIMPLTIPAVIFTLGSISSIVLQICALAYILRSRKYFLQ